MRRHDNEIAHIRAWIADTYWSRMRGLLGHPPLKEGEALIISPCNSIHCFFMMHAIDVVFLDGSGRVLRLCSQVRPWAARVCWRASKVIELAAGEIQRMGLQEGDQCG